MGRRKPLTKAEIEGSLLFDMLSDHVGVEADELVDEVWAQSKDKRRRFTKKMRTAIYTRDKGNCFYCGTWQEQSARFHLDHVIPHSRNGRSVVLNGVIACAKCNLRKSDRYLLTELR